MNKKDIKKWINLGIYSWSYGETPRERWFQAIKKDLGVDVWSVYVDFFPDKGVDVCVKNFAKGDTIRASDKETFEDAVELAYQIASTLPRKFPDSYWRKQREANINSFGIVHHDNIPPKK